MLPTTKFGLSHFIVTERDRQRLGTIIEEARWRGVAATEVLDALEEKLEMAACVPPAALPDDVVTMQSKFRVRDQDSGEVESLVLTYPDQDGGSDGYVSVLAPVGCVLLGCQVGDEVEAKVPSGTRRLRLLDVLY